MTSTELVKPDGIILADGSTPAEWDEPCPVCGDSWHKGPERERWGRQHCWHCGYAPGQTAVAALPGGPAQPDWQKLVNNAVLEAMRSAPQLAAVSNTAALGDQGMAELARRQQEALGFVPPSPDAGFVPDDI